MVLILRCNCNETIEETNESALANKLALQTHEVQQSGGDAHTDDKPVAVTGM